MSNQSWQARREAAVVQGVGTLLPVFIDRAQNAELWDVEGNRYIDFASGIAVLNTGHSSRSSATPASRSPLIRAISSWPRSSTP